VKAPTGDHKLSLGRGIGEFWPSASAGGELLFLGFQGRFEELLKEIAMSASIHFFYFWAPFFFFFPQFFFCPDGKKTPKFP